MANKSRYQKLRARKEQRGNILKLFIQSFAWIGAAILYYVGFSIFFDTPLESTLRASSNQYEEEYEALTSRYDSLMMVLDNIEQRDKSIFNTMFEADPYNFDSNNEDRHLAEYEDMFTTLSTIELNKRFSDKIADVESQMTKLSQGAARMHQKFENSQDKVANIPAIQPVANSQLTLLAASYGMRMHPFYKTLKSHQGVDYAVGEGTRVFATADGVVKGVTINSTAGKSVTIDHGNGYTTTYSNLGATTVWRGKSVKRGDIIALSGNSGLSITPHLHYEVSYNGMRVDPIHYFFMELSPAEYQRMIKIALVGMQSFD